MQDCRVPVKDHLVSMLLVSAFVVLVIVVAWGIAESRDAPADVKHGLFASAAGSAAQFRVTEFDPSLGNAVYSLMILLIAWRWLAQLRTHLRQRRSHRRWRRRGWIA